MAGAEGGLFALGRSTERSNLDLPTKVWALERDADENDDAMAVVREDVKAIKTMLWTVLASVTTAAILLALNLAVGLK